jgi:hypothetical protein
MKVVIHPEARHVSAIAATVSKRAPEISFTSAIVSGYLDHPKKTHEPSQ